MNNRLSLQQIELRYPSASGDRVPYFSLKNDKETRQVRFLYNTINDIYFDIVHEVTVNNKTQTIACLNSDGSNPQGCPLCAHGHNQNIKLYIPVLDLTDNTVKIWTRSKGFIGQLQALAGRNNPISGAVIEVMRIGAPRDPKTQYVLQPVAMNDGKTVEQLGVTLPDHTKMMRVMDYAQMNNYAITLDGNVDAAMPVYQPNANAGAYGQATQNTYATGGYTPNSNTASNPYIGNEPVRRQSASVPTYSNNAPTTPMAGVPANPYGGNNVPDFSNISDGDDELPF